MGTPPESAGRALELKYIAWNDLKEQVEKVADGDPLLREYSELSGTAAAKLSRVPLLLVTPNGYDQVLTIFEEVNELYDRCVDIRAKLWDKNREKSSSIAGKPLRDFYEQDVLSSPMAQTKIGEMALKGIGKIIDRLEVGAESVQAGDKKAKQAGFFRLSSTNNLMVDFSKIESEQARIANLETANRNPDGTEKFPNLGILLQKLKDQLSLIVQTDPAGPERQALRHDGLVIDQMRGKMDTRPLKMLAAGVTGLVTVFGVGLTIGRAVKGEGFKVDVATMGWGTALVALLCPGIFRSQEKNALIAVQKTNNIQLQDLKKAEKIGVGDDAEQVYLAVQDALKIKDFQKFLKQDSMSVAEIGVYITDKDIIKIFAEKFGDDDKARATALRVLATKVSNNEKEFIAKLIKTGKLVIAG